MQKHRTLNTEHRTSNANVPASQASSPPPNAGKRVFDLEQRLLEFASVIIDLTEKLPGTRAGNHVAGQLLRSGTSPYAHHGEAESAESRDDFVHKLKVCLKELRETRRWLLLMQRKNWLADNPQLPWALIEVGELIRIFVASIRTAQQNQIRTKTNQATPGARS